MSGIRAKQKVNISSVAVIGLTEAGLPLAIRAASKGMRTIGFDMDEVKAAQLAQREAVYLSAEEAEEFKRAELLSITSNDADLRDIDAFVICVPALTGEGDAFENLAPLERAMRIVGKHLKEGALVIVESGVFPGVCERVLLPLLEKSSGLSREEFYFAHCPERREDGQREWDLAAIPRVVGGYNRESLAAARALYQTLLEADVYPVASLAEAEAVKMLENLFRDINTAFVNELAINFDRAGIDIVNVIKAASTKPFGFLPYYPNFNSGAHSAGNPYYITRHGRANEFENQFISMSRRINNQMPQYVIRLLQESFDERKKSLRGSVVVVLGLADRKDAPRARGSGAHAIPSALEKKGATVRIFDPYIPGAGRDIKETLIGADAAVIATDHSAFSSLNPRHFEELGVHIVVDSRNCLDKEAFRKSDVLYRGIGRGSL